MEKISRILPSSQRITQVDLNAGGTVRPGAPTFGRPVGGSAEAFNQKVRQENLRSQMVEELNNRFFMRPSEPSAIDAGTELDLADGPGSAESLEEPAFDESELLVGGHLDVRY